MRLLEYTAVERMETSDKQLLRLLIPLLFWICIAYVILLLSPVPQEPPGLPPEAWSYYSNQAPFGNQIFKYRNELLFTIVICAVVSEFVVFFYERRKKV